MTDLEDAVARALWDCGVNGKWEDTFESAKSHYRKCARAAIEATGVGALRAELAKARATISDATLELNQMEDDRSALRVQLAEARARVAELKAALRKIAQWRVAFPEKNYPHYASMAVVTAREALPEDRDAALSTPEQKEEERWVILLRNPTTGSVLIVQEDEQEQAAVWSSEEEAEAGARNVTACRAWPYSIVQAP